MRELTLGATEPKYVARVLGKEMIVGAALALNTILAVSIGGTVPLILKLMQW